jgi:phosphatidylethanolamine-binding protein (PEBP) family uncharacterized protein
MSKIYSGPANHSIDQHMRVLFDNIEYFHEDIIDLGVIRQKREGVFQEPLAQWIPSPYQHYTLLLFDTNAPDGGKLHWLVMNIFEDMIFTGNAVSKYVAPKPPNDDFHHYVFLLYQQKSRLPLYDMTKKFNLQDFEKYYGKHLNKIDYFVFMTNNDPTPLWKYKQVKYTVTEKKGTKYDDRYL